MKSSTRDSSDRYKNPDHDPRGPYLLTDLSTHGERPRLIYSLNGHFPPKGRSWRFTQDRAKQLVEEGRIILKAGRPPRLKRYLSEAASPHGTDTESPAESHLEFIVRTSMKAIASEIARNPDCLRQVEWRDLERALREVFEELGFSTELTRSAKDGGLDLRLQCVERGERKTFLVEVKHWISSGKKVGTREFSALVDVVAEADDDPVGVLLSSSGFSAALMRARAEIERHTIKLGAEKKIVSLCQAYLQSTAGIWRPSADLPDVLLHGTC